MSSRKTKRRRVLKTESAVKNSTRRPYTRSQSINITSVNDDCLMEILSHLSAADLSAVKMSCNRFGYVADAVFEKKCLNAHAMYDLKEENGYKRNAAIMEQFGHLIPAIALNLGKTRSKFHNEYLSLLKHCPDLHSLCICRLNLDNLLIESIEIEAFKKLKQLVLAGCSGTERGLKHLLSECDPLKLKKILIASTAAVCSDDILALIADRMVHLEDLWIVLNETTETSVANVMKMENLKNLKLLDIKMSWDMPIVPLINALARNESLEKLVLMTSTIMDDEIAIAINSLPANVLYCRMWLNARIPRALMAKITHFRSEGCAKGRYENGQKFYEYVLTRWTKWILSRKH